MERKVKAISLIFCVLAVMLMLICLVCASAVFAGTDDGEAIVTFTNDGEANVTFTDDGEAIVTFTKNISVNDAERLTDSNVNTIVSRSSIIHRNEPVLVTNAEKSTEEIINELSEENVIESVQPNFRYVLNDYSDDTNIVPGRGWSHVFMDTKNAWDLIEILNLDKSRRVRVGLIDTGVDFDHPDLQRNVDKDTCVRTVLGTVEPYTPTSQDEHGTKIASIIGADSNNGIGVEGIAAGSRNDLIKISCINVFEPGKREANYSATTADIIAGCEYAREHGAKVINLAFGSISFFVDCYGNPHDDEAIKNEIDSLIADNVTVVCAGGNQNTDVRCYPADFDNVISVIAVRKYKNAWGNPKRSTSSYGMQKTIAAPGNSIPTCILNGEYGTMGATSAASGHTTATIALMLVVNPDLTPAEAKEIICQTATDVYKSGKDDMTSYGVINAYAAVREAAIRYAETGKLVNKKGVAISADAVKLLADIVKPDSYGKTLKGPVIRSIEPYRGKLKLMWSCKYLERVNKIVIYRKKAGGRSYKKVKTFKTEETSWTDTGLKRNQTYYYKIKVFCTSEDGRKLVSSYGKVKSGMTR